MCPVLNSCKHWSRTLTRKRELEAVFTLFSNYMELSFDRLNYTPNKAPWSIKRIVLLSMVTSWSLSMTRYDQRQLKYSWTCYILIFSVSVVHISLLRREILFWRSNLRLVGVLVWLTVPLQLILHKICRIFDAVYVRVLNIFDYLPLLRAHQCWPPCGWSQWHLYQRRRHQLCVYWILGVRNSKISVFFTS